MNCFKGGEHSFLTFNKEVDGKTIIYLECLKCGHIEIVSMRYDSKVIK